MNETETISCLICNEVGESIFIEKMFTLEQRNEMWLSDQINAKNFRIRSSKPPYKTSWHHAGDPTLIAVLQGTLRISLHSGVYKDFTAGDLFIAADNLPQNIALDYSKHGHTAEIIGDTALRAIHIKLDQFNC